MAATSVKEVQREEKVRLRGGTERGHAARARQKDYP